MTTPTPAQIGPVPGETLDDLRIIASGLLADGIDVSKLTNVGRAELRQAIDRILALTAAAEVGEHEPDEMCLRVGHKWIIECRRCGDNRTIQSEINTTIERCARMAEAQVTPTRDWPQHIAAAIRKLNE